MLLYHYYFILLLDTAVNHFDVPIYMYVCMYVCILCIHSIIIFVCVCVMYRACCGKKVLPVLKSLEKLLGLSGNCCSSESG